MAATTQKKKPKPVSTGTEWDRAVLKGIGAPATKANLLFLALWRRAEGGPADNPLNTSWNSRNVSGVVNSSGVKRYNSVQAGIDATVATLKLPYYSNVVKLFRSGHAGAPQIATAVSNSPWDAGHYGAKKNAQGVYVGGHLVGATLGKTDYSTLGNLLTSLPGGKGYSRGVTEEKKAVTGALTGVLSYILYGGAILGGVLLALVAFILIAADLGVSRLAKNPAARGGMKLVNLPKQRAASRATAERSARTEQRTEERHRSNLQSARVRRAAQMSQAKYRKRTKAEQEAAVKRSYIEGARDASS